MSGELLYTGAQKCKLPGMAIDRSKYPLTVVDLSENQLKSIIDMTFEGIPIGTIVKRIGVTPEQFYHYRKRYPSFDQLFNNSRAEAAEYIADKLITVTDDCTTLVEAQLARIKSDNIRTIAGWRKPQVYGQKLEVNHQHTIDLSSVLAAADARVIPLLEAKQLVNMGKIESKDPVSGSIDPIPNPQPSTDRVVYDRLERTKFRQSKVSDGSAGLDGSEAGNAFEDLL